MLVKVELVHPDLKEVFITHIQKLTQVMVLTARNKAQLHVLIVHRDSVRVEFVVLLTDKLKLCSNLEAFKSHASIPVGEAGDVTVQQVTS